MIKKYIALVSSIFLLTSNDLMGADCCITHNKTCDHWYIEGFGGYNWATKNGSSTVANLTIPLPHRNLRRYHPGYLAGGNLGYAWANGFHLEGEASYRYNKSKVERKNDFKAWAFLANCYYQFGLFCLPFDLYFGGGLGYVDSYHKEQHKKHSDDKRKGFAWQFLGGIALPVTSNMELIVEYRFFNQTNGIVRSSSVDAGLRYYF